MNTPDCISATCNRERSTATLKDPLTGVAPESIEVVGLSGADGRIHIHTGTMRPATRTIANAMFRIRWFMLWRLMTSYKIKIEKKRTWRKIRRSVRKLEIDRFPFRKINLNSVIYPPV
jgi:hypothetical protein